jgi:hypothetical protein
MTDTRIQQFCIPSGSVAKLLYYTGQIDYCEFKRRLAEEETDGD